VLPDSLTEAAEQARLVTKQFMEIVKRRYIDEIKIDDILKYHTSLVHRFNAQVQPVGVCTRRS
jgi:hypothetical protein